ncbi:Secreted RxLR effector peptide protein [Phytophthora palmivora]|uniref:Secreted RxLR effector peptide protein n=1 Tax=Phytophthora palmivora TaxID=4796 RepID=A0A2P4XRA5_9STRA|nr:Secreted RxLR effector peptide protein [Phytophthora palmivora]
MRFFLIVAVAALAFVSSCDAAVVGNSVRALNDDNTAGRSLRNYDDELDQVNSKDSEDRAATSSGVYRVWYKAKLTPKQLKAVFGVTTAEMNKMAKELQQFYLGYYSYYAAQKKKEKQREMEKNI